MLLIYWRSLHVRCRQVRAQLFTLHVHWANALVDTHHVMQVHMLVSLHNTVQLAPNFLQDALYTVYTTHCC